MKSNISIKRIFAAIGFVLIASSALIGCSDDESAKPVPVRQTYGLDGNNICRDQNNNEVNPAHCEGHQPRGGGGGNTNNGQYQIINGLCVNLATYQPVSNAYCQQQQQGSCPANEINVPGLGCAPRGNCGPNSFIYGGYCYP